MGGQPIPLSRAGTRNLALLAWACGFRLRALGYPSSVSRSHPGIAGAGLVDRGSDRVPGDRPLAPYMLLAGLFVAAYGGALATARTRGRELPERIGPYDLLLLGTASHKLSRLLSRERVAAFIRAPFTEHQADAGHGEVDERPRGEGMRRAVGELLVCPYCLGAWVAGALTVGFVHAPRPTRLVGATLTALTLSDVLQLAYRELLDMQPASSAASRDNTFRWNVARRRASGDASS